MTVGPAVPHPLAPRVAATPHPGVESWFWRANDATLGVAWWWKATVLRPTRGAPVAQAWAVCFGPHGVVAGRLTVPLVEARFAHQDGQLSVRIGPCAFVGDARGGRLSGHLAAADGTPLAWDVRYASSPGFDQPFTPLPSGWMLRRGFPRAKLVTGTPVAAFEGRASAPGSAPIAGLGMVGHNWGAEHTWRYAWGQCPFVEGSAPVGWMEAFTAQIAAGPLRSPPLSSLVVAHQDRMYRFDQVLRPWRQRAQASPRAWSLDVRGPEGRASVRFTARAAEQVVLPYENPDGTVAWCTNSKRADVAVDVHPTIDPPFSLRAQGAAAFEHLSRSPDPLVPSAL